MIKDLRGTGSTRTSADFLIIGGGTVGLFLSVWLAEAGWNVVCLESGGLHQDTDEHPLNEVVHVKSVYDGAAHGRYRCVGGTSTRWGGALIPFQMADLTTADWPISMEELEPFIKLIEHEFELAGGGYDLAELSSLTHIARLAKWPPFKKRNVFNVLQSRIEKLSNLTVWLNATATHFDVKDGILQTVEARTDSHDVILVGAGRIIFAAGAIETTRLALLLDAQNASIISNQSPSLGCYFSDHLSVVVGEMHSSKAAELNKHIGFRFESNGTMRNLRFELSADRNVRSEVPASFGHIGFETDGQGGFDVLRSLLRSVQKRRPPTITDLIGLVRTSPWLCKAVWSRFVGKRLLFPDNARLPVHMVIAQEPMESNRITLSEDKVDGFGSALAEISWSVTELDQKNLTKAVDAFETMWESIKLSSNTRFTRRAVGEAEADLERGGGIYHPTGSTRMGPTPDRGVVDRDLRLFAVPNIHLVATSALPTGGGANPTMMLMLLAARCVSTMGSP